MAECRYRNSFMNDPSRWASTSRSTQSHQCFHAVMASSRPNRLPAHLRIFYRPSISFDSLQTQAPYSYTSPSKPQTVELCPTHWRIRPKKRLRARVKATLLNSAASSLHHPTQHTRLSRPAMMRMKDSDDYITARAANPRTGIISPSIGSSSPRTPRTPDTPGDALRIQARPKLSRANDGRKISGGSLSKWRTG